VNGLDVCGSGTNAFLNLSRSAGLGARRLLLLTPELRRTARESVLARLSNYFALFEPTRRFTGKSVPLWMVGCMSARTGLTVC